MVVRVRRAGAIGALTLILVGCGPARAPQDHEPLADGRGGHAGTFNAAGDGNDAVAADNQTDTNSLAGNSQ